MLFSTVCLDVYIFFGVQLWKNWAFHHPSIQFYISFHIKSFVMIVNRRNNVSTKSALLWTLNPFSFVFSFHKQDE